MTRTGPLLFAAAGLLAVASFCVPSDASASRREVQNANLMMAWNSCYGTAGAASNLHYACDGSNDGIPLNLVFSFELPSAYPTYHWAQSMATIRIRTSDGSALPDYWRIQLADYGGCRPAIGTISPGSYGFTAFGAGVVDADHCASWYDGAPNFSPALSGVSMAYPPTAGSDRIKVEAASPANYGTDPNDPYGVTYPAGSKLSAGAMVFDTAANGCAGCQQEMTFEIVSMNLEACCGLDYYVLYSSGGPGSSVSWQANTNGPTVVRNRTWGAVKSLYR